MVDQFHQLASAPFGLRKFQRFHQLGVVVRHLSQSLELERAEGRYLVIESAHQHVAVRIFHRGEQSRQLVRRVGRPVSVVPAVQRPHRTVDGDVQVDIAAVAEENQRPAGLVHRAIRVDQDVALQQGAMRIGHALQILRTRLLLALQKKLQVDRQRNVLGVQSVERGHQGDDRRFVVAARTRVDAPVVVVVPRRRWERNYFSSALDRIGTQHGHKGKRTRPGLRIHRLAVVVRINDHRMRRARCLDLREDNRPSAWNAQRLGGKSAPFQHGHNGCGIALDVRRVRGDVGNGQKFGEFSEDGGFVRLAVVAHLFGDGRRARRPSLFCGPCGRV